MHPSGESVNDGRLKCGTARCHLGEHKPLKLTIADSPSVRHWLLKGIDR